MISIVGIPTDKHSSFLRGASEAPPAIKKEFHSEAGNRFSENGLDLGKNGLWKDIGSLDLTGKDNEFEIIVVASKLLFLSNIFRFLSKITGFSLFSYFLQTFKLLRIA